MFNFFNRLNQNGHSRDYQHLIHTKDIKKIYKTDAGDFLALKGINLTIDEGEFVGIVGKSGSGKSTLINMLTGIDHPSSGEVHIAGTPIHLLSEGQMAKWRGRNQGVIFQFFQLLPTLTVIENVMLPMDFCNMYTPRQRKERAMYLLELMDVGQQAHKLPTMISGGQQQRVAIARALANDPPIIVADEPTGNLDSRTARNVFDLFSKLVEEGKTFLMVTHDDDLAKRMSRTIVIADGEIVNEWVVKALPFLSQDMWLSVSQQIETRQYAPGEPIIHRDTEPDNFYILNNGQANIYLERPDGREIFVEAVQPGSFFGEMEIFDGNRRRATVRASRETSVEVSVLNGQDFLNIINQSEETYEMVQDIITQRLKDTANEKLAV